MPERYNNEIFADVLGKHSWFRKSYIYITQSLLLKNNIIKREIKLCGRRKNAQHVLYPGFGMGQILGLFAKFPNKYNVLALDKDCKMVVNSSNYFQEEHINNIYCRSANILEYKECNSFDMALAINLLNYIEDDHKALKNLYNSLRKPGILLIFNSSNYADDKESQLNIGVYHDKKYRTGYGIIELKHKLKEAGFSKVKARYVYGTFGIMSWKLTTSWPSAMIKYSKLTFLIIPFYTLICIPFVFILNLLDMNFYHKKGKCVVVKAFK
jgi:SAM-dependent methyltransferase